MSYSQHVFRILSIYQWAYDKQYCRVGWRQWSPTVDREVLCSVQQACAAQQGDDAQVSAQHAPTYEVRDTGYGGLECVNASVLTRRDAHSLTLVGGD